MFKLDWAKAVSSGDVVGTQAPSIPVNFTSEERLTLADLGIQVGNAFKENLFDQAIDMFMAAEAVGGKDALADVAKKGAFGPKYIKQNEK